MLEMSVPNGTRRADGTTTVLLVEDHLMIAQSLSAALGRAEGITVVGIATTLADAEQAAASLHPDVIVCDFRLPDGEAPEALGRFASAHPASRVVILSAMSDHRSVTRALDAGAVGYLLKEQTLDELVAAIRMVCDGEQAFAPVLVPRLLASAGRAPASADRLTRRELDVLRLLAEGLSTADLAARLHLSVNTVRNHVQSAISRIGAHSKLEAVSIALRDGLISLPGAAPQPRRAR